MFNDFALWPQVGAFVFAFGAVLCLYASLDANRGNSWLRWICFLFGTTFCIVMTAGMMIVAAKTGGYIK